MDVVMMVQTNILCFILWKSLALSFEACLATSLSAFWLSATWSGKRWWRGFGGICFTTASAFPALTLAPKIKKAGQTRDWRLAQGRKDPGGLARLLCRAADGKNPPLRQNIHFLKLLIYWVFCPISTSLQTRAVMLLTQSRFPQLRVEKLTGKRWK